MPQGKLKVKTNVPTASKKKNKSKGPSISRKNHPIAPKKNKITEIQKLKSTISKNVNRSLEEEIRKVAHDDLKPVLSKKKNQAAQSTK
ncbi:uncharacterized protein LOC111047392 [Nilaparvata lugens]|uniref:uncharacterized protein LOC111047392 n=1 Tax=Nilaparvata lugens TaxID=108931 RepID=UPI00193EB30E|nr:uncharacterized protein LOC111047392 [Nilaparvata lugens]